MRKRFWSRGMQPTKPGTGSPSSKPKPAPDSGKRGIQPKQPLPLDARPPRPTKSESCHLSDDKLSFFQLRDGFSTACELIDRYKHLEAQVRAALAVYENDKVYNSTTLLMADKLYVGLDALEGRGS